MSVSAREVFTHRGHPGVEAVVITANGSVGTAVATGGTSVGGQEAVLVHDSQARLGGRGVQKAVDNVNRIIGPSLQGMDVSNQSNIDDVILSLDGTPDKGKLGANATGSVSAAVLKAGAASLGIPLYQYIGGIRACTLPVPGVRTISGARRYGGGARAGLKPTYSLMCYGFDTFREAAYAGYETVCQFIAVLNRRLGQNFTTEQFNRMTINSPIVEHDRVFWDIMAESIVDAGYEGKIGIQVDVAASTYYDQETETFAGLFSGETKTKSQLMELYREMVQSYPFVVIEDPLEENDFAGHACLTQELGIQIVGDDLFATDVSRLETGAGLGAANAALLKVYQKGTITEAFAMADLAVRSGFKVVPCSSRGEGADIADYAVGLNTGQIRESAIDDAGNRLLSIEAELGSRARFLGKAGLAVR